MKENQHTVHQWAVVGAGPAGLITTGLLVDAGVAPDQIIIFDPNFESGDFGARWGEVYSNTTVDLFLRCLTEIKSFQFHARPTPFALEQLPVDGFCQLKQAAEPLSFISCMLRQSIVSVQEKVEGIKVKDHVWALQTANDVYMAEKVILATGSTPRSLSFDGIDEIDLESALKPSKLKNKINQNDIVAVFGSSHSSMIIIKNLLDAGVSKVINFYLTPHRYAVKMGDWTLYDNTGLKGNTAEWVRENISKKCHPQVERYISNDANLTEHLLRCNKAVYAVGFKPREVDAGDIPLDQYDKTNGIIAPGLFGVGIAYPRQKQDPFGNIELNVGLYKFMNDIRSVMPIWQRYGL